MSGCESDTDDWTIVTKEGEINTSQSSESSLEYVNLDSEVVTFSSRKSSERSVSPSDASSRPSSLETDNKNSVLTNKTTGSDPIKGSNSRDPENVGTSDNKPFEQTSNDSETRTLDVKPKVSDGEAGLDSLVANTNSLETNGVNSVVANTDSLKIKDTNIFEAKDANILKAETEDANIFEAKDTKSLKTEDTMNLETKDTKNLKTGVTNKLETIPSFKTEPDSTSCQEETNGERTQSSTDDLPTGGSTSTSNFTTLQTGGSTSTSSSNFTNLQTGGSTSTSSSSFTNLHDELDSMTSSRSSFTALKPDEEEDGRQDLPPLTGSLVDVRQDLPPLTGSLVDVRQDLNPLDGSLVDVSATEKPPTVAGDSCSDADVLENRSDAGSADSDFIRLEVCDSIEVDQTEMTSSSVSSRFSFMGRESASPVHLSPSSSSSDVPVDRGEEEEEEDDVEEDSVHYPNNPPGSLHGNQPVYVDDLHGNQPVGGDDDDGNQNVHNVPEDLVQDDNNQQYNDLHGNDGVDEGVVDLHGNQDGVDEVVPEREEEREGNTESDMEEEGDDEDARIESDQSDAGSTPPLDDDMSFVNDIGEIPLVAGDVARQYVHRPNCHLNLTLDVIAVLMITVVVGLGIGHGIATLDEIEEYESVHDSMRKTILSCEQKRLEDRDTIKDLQKEYGRLQDRYRDSEKSLEKLREQNQALFHEISTTENTETLRVHLKNQINQLELENEELKRSIGQLKYKLHPPNADSGLDDSMIGRSKSCDRSVKTEQPRKLSDYSLDDLELLHDATSLDNSRLKQEVGRLRYTKHPGNVPTTVPEDPQDPVYQEQEVVVTRQPEVSGKYPTKQDKEVKDGQRGEEGGNNPVLEPEDKEESKVEDESLRFVPGDDLSEVPHRETNNQRARQVDEDFQGPKSQQVDTKNEHQMSAQDQGRQLLKGKSPDTTDRGTQQANNVHPDIFSRKKIISLQNEIKAKNKQLLFWQRQYEELVERGLVINSTTCLHYLLHNVSLTDWVAKIDSEMLNQFLKSYSNVAGDVKQSVTDIAGNILNRVSDTGADIWNRFSDQDKEVGENVGTVATDSDKVAGKQEGIDEEKVTSESYSGKKLKNREETDKTNPDKMTRNGESKDNSNQYKTTRNDRKTDNSNQYKTTGNDNNNSTEAENRTKTDESPNDKWSENLKDILNKTRSKMSNVSQQIQDTWVRVKNLSLEFWSKHEPAISRTLDTVSKKVSSIGERVHARIMRRVDNWMRRTTRKKSRHHSKRNGNNVNDRKHQQSNHIKSNTHHRKPQNSNKSSGKKLQKGGKKFTQKVKSRLENISKLVRKLDQHLMENKKRKEKLMRKKSEEKLKRFLEKEVNQAAKQFKKLNEKLRKLDEDTVRSMALADKMLLRDYLNSIRMEFGNRFNGELVKVLNCRCFMWELITAGARGNVRGATSDSVCSGDELFPYEINLFNYLMRQKHDGVDEDDGGSDEDEDDGGSDEDEDEDERAQATATQSGQQRQIPDVKVEYLEVVKDVVDYREEEVGRVDDDDDEEEDVCRRDGSDKITRTGNPSGSFRQQEEKESQKAREHFTDNLSKDESTHRHGNKKGDKSGWVFSRASHREGIRHRESQNDWMFERARGRGDVREKQSESDWLADRATSRENMRQASDREKIHSRQALWDIEDYTRQRHPVNMYSEDRWGDEDFEGYWND